MRPGRSRARSASSSGRRREAGLAEVRAIVREHEAERVVVGMPLTLRGEHGAQALETDAFVEALRGGLGVPVETYDERFTTAIAARAGGDVREDARAAAHLLESYLAERLRTMMRRAGSARRARRSLRALAGCMGDEPAPAPSRRSRRSSACGSSSRRASRGATWPTGSRRCARSRSTSAA